MMVVGRGFLHRRESYTTVDFSMNKKEERIFVMSAPDSHSTFTSVMVGSLYIRVQALNFTETIDDLPFGGRPIDEPPYFISPPAEPSQNRTTRI